MNFYSFDLDFDPMILVLKLGLDNVPGFSGYSERNTDLTEIITYP